MEEEEEQRRVEGDSGRAHTTAEGLRWGRARTTPWKEPRGDPNLARRPLEQ